MARFRMKKGINIGRVVAKITATIIALYVGGTIISEIGSVLNETASPFYEGLSLIGWTITDDVNGTVSSCSLTTANPVTVDNCITSVSGSGILAVIGIIGIATIVMEFVEFKL